MSYILDKDPSSPGQWRIDISPADDCCGTPITAVVFQINDTTDGSGTLEVLVYTTGGAVIGSWTESFAANGLNIADGTSHSLSGSGGKDLCVMDTTAHVQAVPPSTSQVDSSACLPATNPGCTPGSDPSHFDAPDVGAALFCFSKCAGDALTIPQPTNQAAIQQCIQGGCWDCTPISDPQYSRNILTDTASMVSALRQSVAFPLPALQKGPGRINTSGGNVMLTLGLPDCGGWHTLPVLTYNGKAASTSSRWGFGWTGLYDQTIQVDGANAQVNDGHGTPTFYPYRGVSGNYQSHEGTNAILQKQGDGSHLLTYPNGMILKFDATTNNLVQMTNRSGKVWTIASNKIVNPFGERTTIAASGSNMRIVDPAGRITTFQQDGSGNLIKQITPELCVTEMRYDGSHRLVAHIDPEGYRTSYSYNGSGWVTSIRPSDEGRVTVSYDSGVGSTVTDGAGGGDRHRLQRRPERDRDHRRRGKHHQLSMGRQCPDQLCGRQRPEYRARVCERIQRCPAVDAGGAAGGRNVRLRL
jgi:YD repeat-containing protein